ncbi:MULTISPECIES: hypothetical protein [unclassified Wolbachia]|uniref:hypothetical protein n=1 Tax=unclassified Wolbachia TaxID=2640676 RepID=UPI0012E92CC4|nr:MULTISPECIES: hypothetical protein [unclassified Wolbachia]
MLFVHGFPVLSNNFLYKHFCCLSSTLSTLALLAQLYEHCNLQVADGVMKVADTGSFMTVSSE